MHISDLKPVELTGDAVTEWGPSLKPTYWLRMEDGNFRAFNSREFRRQAKIRAGTSIRKVEELMCRAEKVGVKIQPMAGLKPGIYTAKDKRWLVPRFVALTTPPAADDPPPEFAKLAAELAECQDSARDLKLSEQLLRIYAEVRKVEVYPKRDPWLRLLNIRNRLDGFPFDDHRRMFRGKQGFIWTSQPYGYDHHLLPEIVGFAGVYGLTVNISPKWSWYYPGKTVLIEWRCK
jgi:hypothetical protein